MGEKDGKGDNRGKGIGAMRKDKVEEEEKKRSMKITLRWKGKRVDFVIPLLCILLVSVELAFYAYNNWNHTCLWQRILLFFLTGLFFYLVRPGSPLHRIRMNGLKKSHRLICGFVLLVTCLTAYETMTVSDWWSDKGPDYQFQYEAMTEAVLNGHLYLDLEVSPELAAMENPYDPGKRAEENVSFYWDHAFYNGRYYMYFGVVPVFLLFVPLKLIGISLYSYQATQLFVILIITGLFALFREITKRLCPEITLSGFLSVSVAVSWIAVWYAVKYPALYCTAISGGVCMAVWGFFFCWRAFVAENNRKKTAVYAALGAFFSALTFGCRPTVGIYCITLLPLLWHDWKRCKNLKEFGRTLAGFVLPFVIVGGLLMLYNYARFENPFEFGQSYQLTTVDQHAYSDNAFQLNECLSGLLWHFFSYEALSDTFPFLHQDGVLVLFPILFIGFRSFGLTGVKKRGDNMIGGLAAAVSLAVVIISFYHVMWAPIMFRRYAMDFNFLLGILVMFGTCGLYWQTKDHAKLSFGLTLLGAYTFLVCFLLYFVAYDYSIATHQPEILEKVRDLVIFWK